MSDTKKAGNEWLQTFDGPLAGLGEGKLSIREVLDKLLWRTASSKDGPVRTPIVTLTLSTGRDYTGALMAHSEREPRTITLAMGQGHDRHLAFIATGTIVGIVVHDVGELGKPPHGTEVVGRLELARRAKALGEKLGMNAAVEVDDGESVRFAVQLALGYVEEALAGVTSDDAGKAALKTKVDTIMIRGGDVDPGITLDGKRLVLAVKSADTLPSAARMRSEIEALL